MWRKSPVKPTVRLAVSSPCQQGWQQLEASATTGRFCGQCQKTVVDFSVMTDQQILSYLATKTESICGRLNPEQLQRNLVAETSHPTPIDRQRWFSVVTAGLLSWTVVQGQPSKPLVTNTAVTKMIEPDSAKIIDVTSLDSTWVITGQVVSMADGSSLPGVSIGLISTNQSTSTDVDGRFRLVLPNTPPRPSTIRVAWIGFVTQEITILPTRSQPLIISLVEDQAVLGEVLITRNTSVKPKQTLFQKLRNRLKRVH